MDGFFGDGREWWVWMSLRGSGSVPGWFPIVDGTGGCWGTFVVEDVVVGNS